MRSVVTLRDLRRHVGHLTFLNDLDRPVVTGATIKAFTFTGEAAAPVSPERASKRGSPRARGRQGVADQETEDDHLGTRLAVGVERHQHFGELGRRRHDRPFG